MRKPSTTIRIRRADKAKLDALCRQTHRGKVDMLGLLIEREYRATIAPMKRASRKAG